MPLPSSGPLSLNDIQTEFGGTNPISLNEYYAGGSFVPAGTTGTNGAVPSSGAISIFNFYGTAKSINVLMAYFDVSPILYAWQWSETTGIGTKYADPSYPAFAFASGPRWHPSGQAFGLGLSSGGLPFAAAWSDSSGFGTKYANPGTAASTNITTCAFSANGGGFFGGSSTITAGTLNKHAWPFNVSTGFGTKWSSPAGNGNIRRASFNSSGLSFIFGRSTSVVMEAYRWADATGFGTAYSGPSVTASEGAAATFNQQGTFVFFGPGTVAGVRAISWTNASGFGTQTVPSPLFAMTAQAISVSNNSTAVVAAGLTTVAASRLEAKSFNPSTGAWGSSFTAPSTLPSSNVTAAALSPDNSKLVVGCATNTFIQYQFSVSTGIGSTITNSGTLPTAAGAWRNFGFKPNYI